MFKRFLRNQRGNVAMMFGLAAVPLLAATGAAIDFSRAYEERMVVQDAMDSAALAAARLIGIEDDATIIAEAEAFFRTQTSGRLNQDVEIFVQIDGTSVIITTDLAVPTSILGIVGVNDINFDLLSKTESGGRNVEVALVLDITGSMCIPNCNPLIALKAAAVDLVEMVIEDEQTPFYSKVGLVPYSMGVNPGSYFAQAVTITSRSTITGMAWFTGSQLTITGISKQNPARVTAASHGFQTNDIVYISGLIDNGTRSFADNLNGNYYTVTRISSSVFSLNGVNSTSYRTYSSSGGKSQECLVAGCNVVVTESATATAYATGDAIFINSVNVSPDDSTDESYINEFWTVRGGPGS